MHLILSIAGYGHHPAAWGLSGLAASPQGFPQHAGVVARAQSGALDCALFTRPRAAGPNGERIDLAPDTTPLVGSLVAKTSAIGLGATVRVAYTEPFHTARALAVLDGLSSGRTALRLDLRHSAGGDPAFAHARVLSADEHYARAAEYIDILIKLWDSWEDGAIVADKASGIFADSDRIHPIHHQGPWFSVRGPLTAVRPVQGHPVLVFDDATPAGLQLAARFADLFITDSDSPQAVQRLRAELRTLAQRAGRPADAVQVLATVSFVLADSDAEAAARARHLDELAPEGAGLPGHRFVGTADGLAALLDAWDADSVCDGFDLAPAVLPDDLDRFVTGVVPKLLRRRPAAPTATLRERLALARPTNRFSESRS
ncbi:LLM class flavin-dependent oxidoreductase [Paraburkholderia caballeronis]|uniref:Flavin-dependent oxidoreductase, luciferase family (Includes alkanesulfonate monooxygenase SsuD and methylene tetrahydromethanopterin reductase) n=1 Tax=Paraburkholderia caballeronis TaxID=416943 RepID=A0A1H7SWK9_9BURK|nr:LLM class flavin-dependent oxidoreductase [Paraburkholderia caballeronis]PXW25706.1 alkanesulfonate monooxygenase SsuD/methylene tetrahydromethanopterin reductase-like flavin-dependent oxidoreductase (luciferase family) [Paraburkholderia caballeronis]PXX01313.1 alkanesulfonate monooxygenase SsuD/methylene tetrahydromethanopterin reductase-like flavin-dependent oxidoreductase (luciferase family) [Paraburkholderia caballeronis]RAJ99333.1 alkanesulfonate monooxygenase SsuD/methylene tetrahydrome